MVTQNYSLWLMPSGAEASAFSELIDRLAERYSSPHFPPHVTLIGAVHLCEEEVMLKAREVAMAISPFSLALAQLDYTDAYYRSLFVRVEPSPALLAAHREAMKIFSSVPDGSYMPHLSLLYGTFSAALKQRVIAEIGHTWSCVCAVSSLHLYLTEGDAATWREVSEVSLGGTRLA
jgi:2'-5' RNA ligase